MTKWVYSFGGGDAEGDADIEHLLGGKGTGLAQMSRLGLPVPPGFTITTDVCAYFHAHGHAYPDGLRDAVTRALADLGTLAGPRFGDPENPLLVSVRSGAAVSMPGMMDTVLNLGLNETTVAGLAARNGDARFAWDVYRRFLQMYGAVVLGVDPAGFEEILDAARDAKGVELDTDLDAGDLKAVAAQFRAHVAQTLGMPFPDDVQAQLWSAIGAVLKSWHSPRAEAYRRINGMSDDGGTAVTIQAMVFGNRGENSATGVVFTRDPATGEKPLHGEFLINAQGEDVVAGIRTPQPITRLARESRKSRRLSMEEAMPEVFAQLEAVCAQAEAHWRDMQDIEFTVQDGALHLLQVRSGKRTPEAALRIAVAMAEEGLIDRETAVQRVEPAMLERLQQPVLDPDSPKVWIAAGLGASPGVASGAAVFTAEDAVMAAAEGRDVILVRAETSPSDIRGIHAARGLLTARGGLTSHAAVVARGMGRPCVCGVTVLRVDAVAGEFRAGDFIVKRGDVITLDGAAGQIYLGAVAIKTTEPHGDLATLMRWAKLSRED